MQNKKIIVQSGNAIDSQTKSQKKIHVAFEILSFPYILKERKLEELINNYVCYMPAAKARLFLKTLKVK